MQLKLFKSDLKSGNSSTQLGTLFSEIDGTWGCLVKYMLWKSCMTPWGH